MLYLCALAVVLVLARELLALELVQHLADGLSRLRQHRLQGNARSQLTLGLQAVDAGVQKRGDN